MAALLLILLVVPTRALATEHADAVLLTVAASTQEAEQLEAVARELLGRLRLQVELRRVERIDLNEIRQPLGPKQAYFARVWIELTNSGRAARLYLEHAPSDRVLSREVASETDNEELVREELGHILQAALEGLKAGEAIGEPRRDVLEDLAIAPAVSERTPDTARRPARDTSTSAPPRERWRFGPRYEVSWLGDGPHFQDGPGASLELSLPVGAQLAAAYRRPVEVDAAPVGARLQTLSVRLLVTFGVWQDDGEGIRLGAGAGTDLLRVTPLAMSHEAAQVADRAWLKLAVGRLQATYARPIASFAALELTVGVDLDVSDSRLVFRARSGESSVLDPWPVRPLVSLGATVP